MKSTALGILTGFIIFQSVFFTFNSYAERSKVTRLRTHFSVGIKMDKKVYKLGEALEGRIVINNHSPATLPASFEVRLYHEDTLRYSNILYIKTVFTGTTNFQFKNFGIPRLKTDESSLGNWTLVIHQVNRPQESALVEFLVETADNDGK